MDRKLDARAKLIGIFGAIILISSAPVGAWITLAALSVAVIALTVLTRIGVEQIWPRLRLGLPFIILASLIISLESPDRGITVGWKGVLCLTLAAVLILTTSISSLVWALGKLGAPRSVALVSSLMLRYIHLLGAEFARMSRARLSRCGSPLSGLALFQVHANQSGLLLVRSWERAERIHQAMLSRGFTGALPILYPGRFRQSDAIFLACCLLAFAGARFFT